MKHYDYGNKMPTFHQFQRFEGQRMKYFNATRNSLMQHDTV